MSTLLNRTPRFSSVSAMLRHYAGVKRRMASLTPPTVLALPSPEMVANKSWPVMPARPKVGVVTQFVIRVIYEEGHGVADIIQDQRSIDPKNLKMLEGPALRTAITRAIYAVNRALSPDSGSDRRPRVLVRMISEAFKVPPAAMPGATRRQGAVHCRQIACAILARFTNYSTPEIGRAFGGRDHTTALHAIRKYERLVEDVARNGTEI